MHGFGHTGHAFLTPSLLQPSVPDTIAVGRVCQANQEHEARNEEPYDSLHGLKLEDALIDALDDKCVPDEVLQDMDVREAKAMSPCADSGTGVPPHLRNMALEFLATLARETRLPQSTWFQMVAILDVYCRRHKHADTVSRLPATCIALVRMLRKVDKARLIERVLPRGDILNQEEASLLESLDWTIAFPSIESWLSTYCTRFNVLTQGRLVASIAWVWGKTIFNAEVLIRHSPSSTKLPPRKQATGLLGLGVVSAGLLPLDAIAAKTICPVYWQQLFSEIEDTKAQQVAIPNSHVVDGHAKRILELLCMTVGADLKKLQQACTDVAFQLRSATGICIAPSPGVSHMDSSGNRSGAAIHTSV
eukprot:CAMPEP_0172692826 /NCGR_PEP_ID=MMETSP1074-20121228/25537_1 /TAXON_ID=2916 /ORGANISM="Ceratium fusus, Strain PA161109" /LENGTH=361 /DNA_ID=CAMNT_0013513093 /DNA_START=47 /DNA_END=1132 /DNA_ORIENTATION=-